MIFGKSRQSDDSPMAPLVLEALRRVDDPELHRSIVDLGMVKNLTVSADGVVAFEIVLTTTACPLKAQIQQDAVSAAQSVAGVTAVNATISAETLAPKVPQKNPIPGIKNIIAISSGKGGVGKTTVAVNLACVLAQRGARTGILDADIYGPNVPMMMGLHQAIIREKTAEGKMKPPEAHDGIPVMSMAFLVKDDQPVVWRGPVLDRVIRQFFTDTAERS
jgi:ATP-binding protein involved in chromosome partitioning